MISLTLDSLRAHLVKSNYPIQEHSETQQIYLTYDINSHEFPLFLRVLGDRELLQLIAFIPCEMKSQAPGELARLLHRLNKELDLPGFGMDEEVGMLFYRLIMPSTDKKIHGTHLLRYVTAIKDILSNFTPIIAYAANESVSYDEVRQRLQTNMINKL
jgi:hypothetical protein